MAGPGGGPPRKSHTKSRKGCKTCKRRHIRCDELFPQCRNCTKHNCRCDYMDSPPPDESSQSARGPDLRWTHEIEADVDAWQRSGRFPFPELGLNSYSQFFGLSRTDLRLIYHLCNVYREIQRKGMLKCARWVEELPIFLDTAAGYDFVMSAILAFSATHLAWMTQSVETKNLAYQHRGVALNGLHGAIGSFSEATSDPILAASILLSWQASDWGGWTSLMQGISTVVSSMDTWKEGSRLAIKVENEIIFHPSTLVQPQLTLSGAPILADDDVSLEQAIHALQQLCVYLQNDVSLCQRVEQILHSAQEIQTCSAVLRLEQLFEKLQTLRTCLLWMPIALMQSNDIRSVDILVLAHLYSVALAVDASIPELGGALLGRFTLGCIEEIDHKIRHDQSITHRSGMSSQDNLMHFPRYIASRARSQKVPSMRGPETLAPGQRSPYGFQNLHVNSAPSTPGFPPTYPIYGNQSLEDLSIPPSPYLQSYPSSTVRRHSKRVEHSPRPSSLTSYEHSPFGGFDQRTGSPAYSPAGSPGFFEDDAGLRYGESSSGYSGGETTYDESSEKGKGRQNR